MGMDRGVLAVLIGALALTAGQAAAQASRWAYVGSTIGGHTYFDTATVEREAGMAEAWFRDEVPGPPRYVASRTRYRFDCPNRRIGTVSATSYSATGAVKSSFNPPRIQMFVVEVPNTRYENAWAMACPEEAVQLGLKRMGALEEELRRTDPNFDVKFKKMQPFIGWAQANLPATEWARAIGYEWDTLSSQESP